MKNSELYYKTTDILEQAYFNDTLEHGNCYACAVGNIVAANLGYTFKEVLRVDMIMSPSIYKIWTVAKQYRDSGYARWYTGDSMGEVEVAATGYTIDEIWKIENAFENAPRPENMISPSVFNRKNDEWMFNGLMAVIDVLDEIHENKDAEVTITTKKKFKKELV